MLLCVRVQEIYRDMLVAYSQELTRQIQEANEFLRSTEAHVDSFALGVCMLNYTKLFFLRVCLFRFGSFEQ